MRNIIMGIYQAMKNAFIVVATHTLTLKGQLQGNLRQTDIDNFFSICLVPSASSSVWLPKATVYSLAYAVIHSATFVVRTHVIYWSVGLNLGQCTIKFILNPTYCILYGSGADTCGEVCHEPLHFNAISSVFWSWLPPVGFPRKKLHRIGMLVKKWLDTTTPDNLWGGLPTRIKD